MTCTELGADILYGVDVVVGDVEHFDMAMEHRFYASVQERAVLDLDPFDWHEILSHCCTLQQTQQQLLTVILEIHHILPANKIRVVLTLFGPFHWYFIVDQLLQKEVQLLIGVFLGLGHSWVIIFLDFFYFLQDLFQRLHCLLKTRMRVYFYVVQGEGNVGSVSGCGCGGCSKTLHRLEELWLHEFPGWFSLEGQHSKRWFLLVFR